MLCLPLQSILIQKHPLHCCAIIGTWIKNPQGLGRRGSETTWELGKCLLWGKISGMVSSWDCRPCCWSSCRQASSLWASCPHRAALWPSLCGDFTKAFLQLVDGSGHMGWSSEEKGVGFLFSLWLRHVGEHFCGILSVNNLFTLTLASLPSVSLGVQGRRHLTCEASSVTRTKADWGPFLTYTPAALRQASFSALATCH